MNWLAVTTQACIDARGSGAMILRSAWAVSRRKDMRRLGQCVEVLVLGKTGTSELGEGIRLVGLSGESPEAEAIAHAMAMSPRPDIVHAHGMAGWAVAKAVAQELGLKAILSPHLDAAGTPLSSATVQALEQADGVVVAWRGEEDRCRTAKPSRLRRIAAGICPPVEVRKENSAASDPFRRLILTLSAPDTDIVEMLNIGGDADFLNHLRLVALDADVEAGGPAAVHACWYAAAARGAGVLVVDAATASGEDSLMKAAAYGLPTVATDRGYGPEIVRTLGHGEVVPRNDTSALARSVRALLSDRAVWKARSAAGRAAARERTWERHAGELVAFAASLTGGRSSPCGKDFRALLGSSLDAALTGDKAAAARFTAWRLARPDWGFVALTTRPHGEALEVLERWGLPVPDALVSSMGTEIAYWCAANGTYLRDEDYAQRIASDWDAGAVRDALEPGAEYHRWSEEDASPLRCRYISKQPSAYRLVTERLRNAGVKARVVPCLEGVIDVLPVGAGKDAALRRVAKHYRLPLRDCVAVGVNPSDYDMLNVAMKSVITANHCEDLAPLRSMPHVYTARTRFAGGVLEGLANFMAAIDRAPE